MFDDRRTARLSGEDRRIVVACGLGFVVSALDGTVVTAAMPAISADLGGDGFAWLASAYLYSSFVSAPIWGAVCDRLGARHVLAIGLWLLLVSTLLCASAGVISAATGAGGGVAELIGARLLQGAAGGAIFTSSFAISAELFPTRQRIRYAGSFSLVFAFAGLGGALLGGLLADGAGVAFGPAVVAGWRLIFLVQLPVIAAALPLLRRVRSTVPSARRRFDAAGSAALAIGVFLLLAVVDPAQSPDRAWLAAPLAAGALLAFGLFFLIEAKAANPLLHPGLWKMPNMIPACIGAIASSAALLCLTVGLPVYLQMGLGLTATFSGLCIAALSCGIAAGALLTARFVGRKGIRAIATRATLATLAAAASLALQPQRTETLLLVAFVAGMGLGPLQSVFAVTVQAATPAGLAGAGSALIQLTRRLGMVIGAFCAGVTADIGGVGSAGTAQGAAIFLSRWTAAGASTFLIATLFASMALGDGAGEANGADFKRKAQA